MDYRFLGIAWPSPVTVDFLLCNMKLIYEDMSTEISIFLRTYLDPSYKEKVCFFPPCIYLILQIYVQIYIFEMFAV